MCSVVSSTVRVGHGVGMSDLSVLRHFLTIDLVRNASMSDLLEEMADYENATLKALDEDDHVMYQACKDAIVVKSITGR